MLSSLSKSKKPGESRGIPESLIVMVLRFVTLIWLGVLSRAFWPLKTTILLIISLELVFFAVIYRQIERYYRWYEERFLSTFQIKEDSKVRSEAEELSHLAPWDAHLVKLRVHPNATLSSKSLLETKLRDRFGINVVMIQRGERVIVAPRPDEKLLPQDDLLVLGTDDQLDQVRPLIEIPEPSGEFKPRTTDYEMRQIRLNPQSPLVGLTIRKSGIRENFEAMVVGIERNHKRTINPESDLTLQSGDTLWIVGDRGQLSRLAQD
jgi:CPA2 family monovalent cation:H+ antiporter-2